MNQEFVDAHLPPITSAGQARRTRKLRRNIAESPLTWLHARKLLSDRQLAAGELLRQDFEHAGLGPQVTMKWDAPPLGRQRRSARSPGAQTHAALSAKQRFHAALDLAGPGLADILWRVVCAGEGVSASERQLGWPSRAGKLVLCFALDRVADYYQVP